MTNQDLLDIPEFLKRQSDSDKAESKSVEAKIEVKEEPKQEEVQVVKEAEPVKEKPKKPSIQDRMRTRFFVIMGDIHDEFEKVWADNGNPKKFKAYDYFAVNDIPGAFMKMIIEDKLVMT